MNSFDNFTMVELSFNLELVVTCNRIVLNFDPDFVPSVNLQQVQ